VDVGIWLAGHIVAGSALVKAWWRRIGAGPRMLVGAGWMAVCALLVVADRDAAGLAAFLGLPAMVVTAVYACGMLRDLRGPGPRFLAVLALGVATVITGPVAISDSTLGLVGQVITCSTHDARSVLDSEGTAYVTVATARCPDGVVETIYAERTDRPATLLVAPWGVPARTPADALTPVAVRVVGSVVTAGWIAVLAWAWVVWRRKPVADG